MGFRKSGFQREFTVRRTYTCINEDTGITENVTVTHILRLPTAGERNQYERDQVLIRGKKVKRMVTESKWSLWRRIVLDVEGYDDLDEQYERDADGRLKGKAWHAYFDDDIGRIHAEEAIDTVMDQIEGEEEDLEKKSEESSSLLPNLPEQLTPTGTIKS